ncbi:hypothetical protein HYPBUDRAFT_11718 [Hyphopichia burtonii NRRL Y-1933]|uniref:Uncharacterized protein n=1 Tax=Hyphopichia burtonii NRRL Y-1933 TaxID=984485 RepID=A0A1E4RIL7_9ASCO|nr:hypothetical protein HYPBUDRAFT_11718 [Hyphopichia burtonii NRRL Y-1933]ODV67118.1 hypothetical protein HYPBUDRAFT_11718 [Hyphopichia burtonii NRRL Y-1933]
MKLSTFAIGSLTLLGSAQAVQDSYYEIEKRNIAQIVPRDESASANYSLISSAPPSTTTEIGTTVITITSCGSEHCTPITTGVVTVTEEYTTYTTYCPLPSTYIPSSTAESSSSWIHPPESSSSWIHPPSSSATETEISTTVITVTSCESEHCTPITTGVTTVTEEHTTYTTYCPLPSETTTPVESSKPVESTTPTEAPTTKAPTTEAPTTEAPTTEAPTTEAPTTEATTPAEGTTPAVVPPAEGTTQPTSVEAETKTPSEATGATPTTPTTEATSQPTTVAAESTSPTAVPEVSTAEENAAANKAVGAAAGLFALAAFII